MGSRASQVKGRARSGARASDFGLFFFFLGGGISRFQGQRL